jgi:hypothetical protein
MALEAGAIAYAGRIERGVWAQIACAGARNPTFDGSLVNTFTQRIRVHQAESDPFRATFGPNLHDVVAHALEVSAKGKKHPRGDPLAFPQKAEKKVFRPDVVIAELTGLVDGQLDDPLGPRRQTYFANDGLVAATDDEFHGGPDLRELDPLVGKNVRRDTLALADEPKQ